MNDLRAWGECIPKENTTQHSPCQNRRISAHQYACRIKNRYNGQKCRNRCTGAHGYKRGDKKTENRKASSAQMQMHTDPDKAGANLSDSQKLGKDTDNHEDYNQSGISILSKSAYNRIPVMCLVSTQEEPDQYGKYGCQNKRLHGIIMKTDHDDTA